MERAQHQHLLRIHRDLHWVHDALRSRDRAADRRLYHRLQPVIRATVAAEAPRLAGRGIGPEDFLQNAWLYLMEDDRRRLGTFDPAKGTLDAFVRQITKNAMRDLVRRREHPTDPLEAEPPAPGRGEEARMAARLHFEALWDRVHPSMGARSRQIFEGVFLHGEGPAELARRLGVAPAVIYSETYRIRRRFREAELEVQVA